MPAPAALHVDQFGTAGSPIVLVHGLFGQGRNWMTIAKSLAEDHRVLLVDLPHHGSSPWADAFDFAEAAEQLAAVIDPDEPATLVGHSLGGKVAMLTTLLHPELVARLCVADVAPVRYDNTREFAGYLSALQSLPLERFERRSDADEALAPAVPNVAVRSFLLQNLRRDGDDWRWQANLAVLERDLDVIGGWPDELVADAPAYAEPVLWLAGDRSDYVQPEYEEAMERYFPLTRKVVIKGAGHWLHSEKPEVFTEVLRRFARG